jgi:transposase
MQNSLRKVCERLNINFSSAKNVIQIYKKEGRLEKKVTRQRKSTFNKTGRLTPKNGSKSDGSCDDFEDGLLEEFKQPKEINNRVFRHQDEEGSCGVLLVLTEED